MDIKDSFFIKIHLVITAADQNRGESLILVDYFDVPSIYLTRGQKPKEIAEKLLVKYTGVSTEWAMIIPIGLVEIADNEAHVLFATFLPDTTRLRVDTTRWLSYDNVQKSDKVDSLTKKLIYETIWRAI